MKEKLFLIALFLVSIVVSAQIKGVVKDSISGKPIPYVNISVENENIGTTSEENGEFVINSNDKSKNLVFSALGFEKKKVKISKMLEVNLKPIAYQLDEIVISKRFETREVEIGETKSEIFQAFDNGPRIDTKFFPYYQSYKRTKFIKQVAIFTDSRIENATFKIHFYAVDATGFPAEELLNKNLLVSVNKGSKETKFNVTRFNLRMPKNGIFVGFEKLIIEKNKLENTVTDLNTNTAHIQKTYFPFIMYNSVARDFLFTFSGGKWNKLIKEKEKNAPSKVKVYEPAINLILTN
jgi:hypothetical protein